MDSHTLLDLMNKIDEPCPLLSSMMKSVSTS